MKTLKVLTNNELECVNFAAMISDLFWYGISDKTGLALYIEDLGYEHKDNEDEYFYSPEFFEDFDNHLYEKGYKTLADFVKDAIDEDDFDLYIYEKGIVTVERFSKEESNLKQFLIDYLYSEKGNWAYERAEKMAVADGVLVYDDNDEYVSGSVDAWLEKQDIDTIKDIALTSVDYLAVKVLGNKFIGVNYDDNYNVVFDYNELIEKEWWY